MFIPGEGARLPKEGVEEQGLSHRHVRTAVQRYWLELLYELDCPSFSHNYLLFVCFSVSLFVCVTILCLSVSLFPFPLITSPMHSFPLFEQFKELLLELKFFAECLI